MASSKNPTDLMCFPSGLPFNIGNMWELGLRLFDDTADVAAERFRSCTWFNPIEDQHYKPQAVIIKTSGNSFTCSKVEVGTPGSVTLRAYTDEERSLVGINTGVTIELLAALLFSSLEHNETQ
jgi:hypothetical protein